MLCAAAPLFAQIRGGSPTSQTPDPGAFAWPSEIGSGTFGRAEAGQLTEDRVVDLVIARGPTVSSGTSDDVLTLVYGPSIYRALVPLPLEASDFAIVRGAGPNGRDALAITRAHGAFLVNVLDGAVTLEETDLKLPQFANARRLRSADLDGDGDFDLIAIDASGGAIVTAYQDANGFSSGATFPAPGTKTHRDLAVLGTFFGPSPHLALLDDTGLSFLEVDPGAASAKLVRFYASVAAEGSISALRSLDGSSADVAWLTSDAAQRNQVLLVANDQKIAPNPLTFEAEEASVLVCEDLDADGDSDALITRRSLTGALLRFNNESIGMLAFEEQKSFGMSLVPSGIPATHEPKQNAWPVVADLDSDGVEDVFLACEAAQRLGWTRGPIVDPELAVASVGISAPAVQYAIYRNEPLGVLSPTSTGILRLGIKVPTTLEAEIKLQIVAWRQNGFGSETEPIAVARAHVDLPVEDDEGEGSSNIQTHDIAITEGGAYPFKAIHWLELRYVRVDSVGNLVETLGPARVYAFAASKEGTWKGPSLLPLLGKPVAGPPIPVFFQTGGFDAAAVLCGGVVPKATIPSFPIGKLPKPKPGANGDASN